MKRIFTVVLILVAGSLFSQTTIFSEDFSSPTFSFTSDWFLDNTHFYPDCNVPGSSGGNKLIAQQANSATFEETGNSTAINTSTFVSIQVNWNMINGTSLAPPMTFQWSNDAGVTWNTVAYTVPSTPSVWTAVSVSLPSTASGTLISIRFTYTSIGGFTDYFGIDDIIVAGIPSPSYYWNGGQLHQVNSWGINTNGTGAHPPDFITPNQNFYLINATTTVAALTAPWTISGANSVLNIGDGTVANQFSLTIPSSFALTVNSGAKLNVSNNSMLTLQNTNFPPITNVTLGSNSTVNWGQSSAVTIWLATYGNLIFSGTGNRNQTAGTTVVGGDFVIGAANNYVLINSPASVTELSGKIVCNGNITGGVSNITIDGSSANTIGTLNFNGTANVNNLILNRTGQTLTLGTNLTCGGVLSQTTQLINGNVNLNGKSLTLNGPITFPASAANGSIVGSTTSTLSITGTGAINNALIMDVSATANKSLGAFNLSRSNSTLTLGTDLSIAASVFTNGSLNINGNLLTLSGAITFPAASSNGVFTGSSTSSLVISGSGAITNSLFMDQSSSSASSLGDFFTLRNLATVTLGSNLTVAGTASLILGIIDINGNSLEFSGPVVFPASSANKGFNGSLTSTLTIDGSGTISGGSLYMNQSSATTRALAGFTLNRAGVTLPIGNNLETYGTVLVTQGTLGSGGNLFLRSTASNKGSLGPVGGSVTGNVKVETFALSGSTGWTNLASSGINGLTVASWEGQIPMTCFNCPNDQTSAGGYFVSIQGWDETAAASSTTAYLPLSYTSPLPVGTGYWVYLGNGASTTTDMTWSVSGTAAQGTFPVSLSFSGAGNGNGYNFIGNPYASPISWSSVVASNSGPFSGPVDGAIYVYNPDLGYTTSYNSGIQSDPTGISDIIPMGQGFYVQALAAATINFQESNKVINNNSPLLRTANATNIGTVVRLKVEGNGLSDNTALRFHSDATVNYDGALDAHKIFTSPGSTIGNNAINSQRTTISTRSGAGNTPNEDYSINSLPLAITQDAVIPVLVRVKTSGQHTITATDLQNLPNSCVVLRDKLDNSTHDLKAAPYVCTINDTTAAPRFELRVCADIAMSVDEQKIVNDQSVAITTDANGAVIKFNLTQPSKSVISVTNLMGQKVIDPKTVTVDKDTIYLPLEEKHQLLIISVTTDNSRVTKKIIR